MPKGPKAPKTWHATSADHGSDGFDGFLLIDETGIIQDDGGQTPVGRHIGSLVPDAIAFMSESAEERDALSRLARVLAAGGPPAADVRRGFYLNIQV